MAEPKQGLATSDNNRFLREWFEININKACFEATDIIYSVFTGKKWFPYNKGGEFRRWYGNQDYLVNWEKDGREIRSITKNGKIASRVQNSQYYFQQCISWSKISTGDISFRMFPKGFIFDVAGCSVFFDDESQMYYVLGLLNSKTTQYILNVLSPTMNFEVGQIASLPIIKSIKSEEIAEISKTNICKSKEDWDSFETSWDFKKHPLI